MYYDVFKKRMTADGSTYKEQVQSLSRKNFSNYLKETPTAETVLVDGFPFHVAIVENKQDEYRLSKQMLSAIDDYFAVGTLVNWNRFSPADSPENFWIVWKQQQNSIQDYYLNYISRCNHKLKWIDEHGVRYEQYVYEFSSKETMIRATFKSRVQEIIASEPNKFMEIIMPYTDKIKREQRFIIDGEAWYVIEFDSSSVRGITYITLGEDKKDYQNDKLIVNGDDEDLANAVDENKNVIKVVNEAPLVEKNTNYIITPTYYKEGMYIPNVQYLFTVDHIKQYTGTYYEQLYDKDTEITIQLANNPDIRTTIIVKVQEEPVEDYVYVIHGNNTIKWGRTAEYTVQKEYCGVTQNCANADYVLTNDELATLTVEDGVCYIKANSSRKTGSVTLTAIIPKEEGEQDTVSKVIQIVSLW